MAEETPSNWLVTVARLASYLGQFPAGLRAWRSGANNLYPILSWINTKAVTDLRDAYAEMGQIAVRLSPVLHNQAGTAVSWAIRHLGAQTEADPGERSRRIMWELARRHWVVSNLLSEVRQGSRGFEATDRRIRLPFIGDQNLDALDRMLDLLSEVRGLDVEGRPSGRRMQPWLDAGGRDTAWDQAPPFVHEHYRALSRALMGSYPRYLPEDLDVGGFTMREATQVLIELLARAQYSQACIMRYSTSALATIPFFKPEDLAADLARQTGVALPSVERVVATLTVDLDVCPDPCLTPIVPVGQALVPMSGLIAPGSPVRNLTALLQLNPSRFGAAGRALGQLGVDACAETLKRVAGVRLATNVDLVTSTGRRVGDLDVALIDPLARLMVVFEVTWQIGPDGAIEIGRALGKAAEKRDQVARNRKHLAGGTVTPRWPSGWPDVTDFATRWYVLTRDVLPLGPAQSDVLIRSHQVVAWMLRSGASLADLVTLLDAPPTPPHEIADLQWNSVKFGRYTIEWDQVAV
jgi:hypothetical protein